ncbi:MAG: tRNA uridine-5-carboxymethylaminomethyl(34) synthesis GTPase MnmE [Gammaproteobacteria bacterium]
MLKPEKLDTIAAIATPPGRGGIGVIRLSGPAVPAVATELLGCLPQPRRAEYCLIRTADNTLIDQCIVLYFPAPHSFTGEHVLEIQGHGGPVVQDWLMERLLGLDIRQALPGEFSERAFLNDKLDLAQAESIADLIDSSSRQAAQAAMRSLEGEFSRHINGLVEQITHLRIYVEAAIDFPEEEIDFLAGGQVEHQIEDILNVFDTVFKQAKQGRLLTEGLHLVITGLPNAGKSSLLNAMAGQDCAIVTAMAGTTRDAIHENIHIDGIPIHLVDTAGLHDSADPIEQEGMNRTWKQIEKADLILHIIDDSDQREQENQALLKQFPQHIPVSRIYNKVDKSGREAGAVTDNSIAISVKIRTGLDELRSHIKQRAGLNDEMESGFSARRRHLQVLEQALKHVISAQHLLRDKTGELIAEELRIAQQKLSEITGEFSSDDLLGEIFSSFCIGK